MIAVLLALVLAGPAPASRPRPDLTPGVTRPLTRDAVCSIKWGTDRRHVTLTMKRHVFAAYGIPYSAHALYEVDHLISRELGGADDERNLWPQIWTGDANAHMKDRLENALHREVCAGRITLPFAQTAIRTDWLAAYRLYVVDAVKARR